MDAVSGSQELLAGNTGRTHSLVRKTAVVLLALISTATAGAHAPQNPVTSVTAKVRHWLQVGEASWYGRAVQGHKTASGERFDMNAMTCAHRTLPLGSWLRVTNLSNRRSVLVRVTDRGPMSPTRIVDMSYAAAHAIGIGGVSRVQLEALSPDDPTIVTTLAADLSSPGMAMRLR